MLKRSVKPRNLNGTDPSAGEHCSPVRLLLEYMGDCVTVARQLREFPYIYSGETGCRLVTSVTRVSTHTHTHTHTHTDTTQHAQGHDDDRGTKLRQTANSQLPLCGANFLGDTPLRPICDLSGWDDTVTRSTVGAFLPLESRHESAQSTARKRQLKRVKQKKLESKNGYAQK